MSHRCTFVISQILNLNIIFGMETESTNFMLFGEEQCIEKEDDLPGQD